VTDFSGEFSFYFQLFNPQIARERNRRMPRLNREEKSQFVGLWSAYGTSRAPAIPPNGVGVHLVGTAPQMRPPISSLRRNPQNQNSLESHD
jgi:hypothetical protein